MTNSAIKNIKTEAEFQELIATSDKPVMVDFWATWCGPCRVMGPILDEVASERDDITIAKVDVDELEGLSAMFRIQSIPTILTFKNGQMDPRRIIGAVPKARLNEGINELVK